MTLNELVNYKETELLQSFNFAASLGLGKEEVKLIDKWVDSWIDLNIKDDQEEKETENFKNLYFSLQKILFHIKGSSLKYLAGRLIKIHDIMWHGIFSPFINSSKCEIKHFIDNALSSIEVFNQIEFTSFLAYLRGTPVNPNSEIFDYIWKIEKQSKFFHTANFFMRNKALKYLLDINGKRGFHHTIKDFKKILGFIKPDNTDIINYLCHYKVKNNQGCYQAISFILRDIENKSFNTFQTKKDCIIWLDNAAGSSPKKPWMDKLTAIQKELQDEELLKMTHWILNNEVLERDQSTGWVDSIYKRFQKSSHWYLVSQASNSNK